MGENRISFGPFLLGFCYAILVNTVLFMKTVLVSSWFPFQLVVLTFLKGLFWTTNIKLDLLAPSRTPSSWFISKKHESDFTKQCWYSLEPPEHRGNCHVQFIAKLPHILVGAAFCLKSPTELHSPISLCWLFLKTVHFSFILFICLWTTAQICHHLFSLILQL